MKNHNYLLKKIIFLSSLALFVVSFVLSPTSFAMNGNYDETMFSGNDITFYNPDESDCSTNTSSSSGDATITNGKAASYSLDQVKAFISSPINSAWGVSDSSAEQWFLKQAGAKATISKYGLNASNIGQITSTVKSAGVSPILFYAYTVNEGGGAGGFINHFGNSTGSGTDDASRDAKYLSDWSKQTGGHPATGGGEPSNMPTAEAQAILNTLPSGSVGVVYIQATSAATAELEDLSGKTGDWTNKFGKPLTGVMNAISQLGGNPMNGEVSSACSDVAAIAGAGMTKGINWAKAIANNDGYGYDQTGGAGRESGWNKYQSDPGCTSSCGDFDCSSFVSAILTVAGYFTTNPNFSTSTEAEELKGVGFEKIASSASSSKDLQPGDILIRTGVHTEMYIGNDQLVGAHQNEKGGINGGKVGDQTGNEISIKTFYNDKWDQVWRATK